MKEKQVQMEKIQANARRSIAKNAHGRSSEEQEEEAGAVARRRKLQSYVSRKQAECENEYVGPCFPVVNQTWPNYDLGYVTPSLLSSFYNISNSTVEKGSLGIFASLGQTFNSADLEYFQDALDLPRTPFDEEYDVHQHMGRNLSAGLEATLDVQWLTAVAQAQENWFWYKNYTGSSYMVEFLVEVAAADSYPDIISMSYFTIEASMAA